jgi:carboxylate-amine ligase
MMRTVGVEEELLVVDTETGRPRSVAGRVLGLAQERDDREPGEGGRSVEGEPGGSLGAELQQQQVETDTPPRTDLAELETDLRAWREVAIRAARQAGARIVAAGTSPLPVQPLPQHDPRYERMRERFGLTSAEQLTCGCHVHVAVHSDDEAVGALDRIRVWLPALLALSANSPFWQGQDSGYASFRSQALVRWPSAGPPDTFGSADAYRKRIDDMVGSGVLLDAGMVYFDARLSAEYPTLEIRAADVCLDARDTVLVAALCRALVDTGSAEWAQGRPPADVPTAMLRLATWQAAREGVDGALLDPLTCRPRPVTDVVAALVEHVRPALRANGDERMVEQGVARVLTGGNGARRQRAVLAKTGQLVDVVADLARVTAGLED